MSDVRLQLLNRVSVVPARNSGLVSDIFRPGRWQDVSERDVSSFSAICGQYERDQPSAGSWHADQIHYFDLSLSGRPDTSHGCFADAFRDYQRLGRIFFVPAGHRCNGEGGAGQQRNLFVFLRTRSEYPDEAMFDGGSAPELRQCLNLKCAAIEDLLVRIAREMAAPGFASEMMLEGLGITLLVETARMLKSLRPHDTRKGGLPPWRLKIIEDRIRSGEHLPSVAELADLCGISRRQLMRAFREETGQTLGAFVQQQAQDRARTLLAEGGEPIAMIAARIGFGSAAAFSTAFRRATGQSPRDFRAACHGPTAPSARHH